VIEKAVKYTCLILIPIAVISRTNFKREKAEKALSRYVHENFIYPASYKKILYYPAMRIETSEEDANAVNSILSDRNVKAFNGWGIAVDIQALNSFGNING
jgi:hypothetical protein